MSRSCTITQSRHEPVNQRESTRSPLALSGRLVWKDSRAATRFASVVIRNVSATGAFVECVSGTPIPMYRLVHLQTDRPTDHQELPLPLRQGRVLAAIFRIEGSGPAVTPRGYGLRLLEEPAGRASRTKPLAEGTQRVVAMAGRSIA